MTLFSVYLNSLICTIVFSKTRTAEERGIRIRAYGLAGSQAINLSQFINFILLLALLLLALFFNTQAETILTESW